MNKIASKSSFFFLLVFLLSVASIAGCARLSRSVGPLIMDQPAIFFADCAKFSINPSSDKKYIALTIDDGPSALYTEDILTALDEHDIKATFFIIGSAASKNKDLIKTISNSGHDLGNHGYEDESTQKLSREELKTNLKKTHELISHYKKIDFVRPPQAKYNKNFLELAHSSDFNYQILLADLYTMDHMIHWAGWHSFWIKNSALNGSIIALHDGEEKHRGRRTVKIINEIVPKLKNKGFEFVTLSSMKNTCDMKEI